MTEAGVASNRSNLGRKWTVLEQLSDALLVIRLDVYSDSQEKGMIFAAIPAVNGNITRWHRADPRLWEYSLTSGATARRFCLLRTSGIRRLVQRLCECTRQFDYAGRRLFHYSSSPTPG